MVSSGVINTYREGRIIMKLEINRNEWLRGEDKNSCLLRGRDGRMCCLGIYGRAIGIPIDGLLEQMEPERKEDEYGRYYDWPDWLGNPGYVDGKPTDEQQLITMNDAPSVDESKREQDIAIIFARHGVEVTFYDGPEAKPVEL